MKKKKFIVSALAVALGAFLFAQVAVSLSDPVIEDVTAKVVNPTLNETKDGWISTTGAQNSALATNKVDGIAFTGKFFENWNKDVFTGGISQEIAELPAGVYKLTLAAFAQNPAGNTGTGTYVFANEDLSVQVDANTPKFYYVFTTLTEGATLKIGVVAQEATNNWIGIDNASLTYYGTDITTSDAMLADYNSLHAAASNLKASYTAPVSAEILDGLLSASAPTTLADYTTAYPALQKAMADFKEINDLIQVKTDLLEAMKTSTETEQTDLIQLIVNPNADNGIAGWTLEGNTNLRTMNNEHYSNEINPYFDTNNWGGTIVGAFTQTLTDMPAGVYTLSAVARGNMEQGSVVLNGKKVTIEMVGNQGGSLERGWNKYVVTDTLTEAGSLTLGIELNNTSGSKWFSADEFTLSGYVLPKTPVATSYKALVAWGNCKTGSIEGTSGNNQLIGNAGDTAEGFILALTGNTAKTYSAANKIDVTLPDGTTGSRTTIKLSNAAQNTLFLPEGKVATKVTFYSYVNLPEDKRKVNVGVDGKDDTGFGYRTSYWKEVAGTAYTKESATWMNVFVDGIRLADNSIASEGWTSGMCDVISFDLNKVSEITFTQTGEQACVIIGVEYEDAATEDPELTEAVASLQEAVVTAKALLASYENPTDEAGLAAKIAEAETLIATPTTVTDVNTMIAALATVSEAFVAENTVTPEPEKPSEYTQVGVIDFEDKATYADGWTLGGGVTQYWNVRADGTHFMNVKENMKGDRSNTYEISNTKFLTADEWKMEFDWAVYSSNDKSSSLIVYGDNVDTLFYAVVPGWAADPMVATIYTSAGVALGTIAVDAQDKATRGDSCAVSTWYHFTLQGNADGVTLAVSDATGTEVLAASKVSEFAHATGFNLLLGKALSQMALDDIKMSIVVPKSWVSVGAIDFEDEATYVDGWTLGSKTTAYYGERTLGETSSHFMNLKNTGSGNDDNTYTITNTKFLGAEEWKLDFDFAGYNSNSKTPYLAVLSGTTKLLNISFPATWSAPVNVADSVGTILGTVNCDEMARDTRDLPIAVTVWHHVTLEGSNDGVYLTVTAVDGTVEIERVKIYGTNIHPTGFNLHQGNALSQWALDDIMMSIFTASEILDAPAISIEGETTTSNLITITGADGLTVMYTLNGGEEQIYTAPFRIYETTEVAAWVVKEDNTSEKTIRNIEAGVVAVPTATIAAVDGVNRTLSLACATENSTIQYKLSAEAGYTAYTDPFVIADTVTLYAIAKLNDVHVTDYEFTSDTLSTSIAAGTEIALNAPTFGKVSYDEETKMSVYSIAVDQSSVLCAPTSTINYEFYKLNTETGRVSETADMSGAYESELTLPIGLLKATANAAGYASTESHIWLKAPAELTEVWSIDFDSMAIALRANNNDKDTLVTATYGDVLFNGKFRSNATSDFSVAIFGDTTLTDNFALQTGTSWYLRHAGGENYGLYNANSGDRAFGFNNLKNHQVVYVKYGDATQAIFKDGVIEDNIGMTSGNDVYYNVTADGTATVAMNRYYYIKKVAVYLSSDVTQAPEISVTKCDGEKRTVAMTSGTMGADIFYATGTAREETVQVIERIDSTLVTPADPDAGTEAVYDCDTIWVDQINKIVEYGDYQAYTGDIEVNETAYFRAYAIYQDSESDIVESMVEAGVTVQLATPVITYTPVEGQTEGTKSFTIVVDNSKVISAPVAPIYYTVPGEAEKLYEGGAITVADASYGWLKAVCRLDGYDESEAAVRYIDARAGYNEIYQAVTENTTVMPTEAADLEIDCVEALDVEQAAALKTTGRMYIHRKVSGAAINVVLPFAMTNNNLESGEVAITDATGNKLTRGEDFLVYEIEAAEEPASAVHTGNLVAGAKAYLIQPLKQIAGDEMIFVSTIGNTLAINQTTFNQPTSGYSVKTNRRLIPVVLDIPAYMLNAAGTAFELVQPAEGGVVVPALTAVILADETICADDSKKVLPLTVITGVDESIASDKEIESVKYYTPAGVELNEPIQGIIIKRIVYVDGTSKTMKILVK